ncbi:hypothetical protein B0H11DRAFT_1998403 [Mycena galericulata]|nr:hypothetical protein B0H11DRAFT_1998403 [Mycena galericulata]
MASPLRRKPERRPTRETSSSDRAADRARIAYIDSEMMALQLVHLPRTLYKERKRAQTRLDAYKYPVLTLPDEIVSEIFTHVLPVYPRRPPATGLRSPTLLSHICSKWRDIALSTPRLWRAISLALMVENLPSQLHFLETWLARSRSCPLSINMMSILGVDRHLADLFIRTAVRHCDRWGHIWLLVPQDTVSLIRGDMPLLRELRIGLHRPRNASPVAPFQDAPHLRTVILMSFIPPEIILPWARFTRFITRNLSQARCSEVLAHMPNLVYCKLQLFGSNSVLKPQSLAHLETLILEDVSFPANHLTGLLASLTLPALRRLHIPERFLLPDPVNTLTSFVARSGCSLKQVYIVGLEASAHDYQVALPSIPTLLVEQTYTGEDVDSEPDSDDGAMD